MTQRIREVLPPNSLLDGPTNAVDSNGDVVPLDVDNYTLHTDETPTIEPDESPLERGKRLAKEMLELAATVREQNPNETELPSDDNREMYRRPITNASNNRPATEKKIVYCGDCGLPIPCAHTNGRRTFGY